MGTKRTVWLKGALLCGLALGVFACATAPAAEEKTADKPKGPTVVGGVTMLPEKKGLEISGKVCQQAGILDFLSVVTGGREYESVLTLDVQPSALHASLVALGAKPGPTQAAIDWKMRTEKEAGRTPKKMEAGSRLLITVRWQTPEGKTQEVPATTLLFNRRTKQTEPETNPWIFTGSFFGKTTDGKSVYVANVEQVVIAVKSDGAAVINLEQDAGNPYDSPDKGFIPNKDVIPALGTPITMHIELAPAEPKPEAKPEPKAEK